MWRLWSWVFTGIFLQKKTFLPIMPPETGSGIRRMAMWSGLEICPPSAVGFQHPEKITNIFYTGSKPFGKAESMCLEGTEHLPETGRALWWCQSLENLARYIIRASFSQERMAYIPANDTSDDTKVVYESKDGKTSKTYRCSGLARPADHQHNILDIFVFLKLLIRHANHSLLTPPKFKDYDTDCWMVARLRYLQ